MYFFVTKLKVAQMIFSAVISRVTSSMTSFRDLFLRDVFHTLYNTLSHVGYNCSFG